MTDVALGSYGCLKMCKFEDRNQNVLDSSHLKCLDLYIFPRIEIKAAMSLSFYLTLVNSLVIDSLTSCFKLTCVVELMLIK